MKKRLVLPALTIGFCSLMLTGCEKSLSDTAADVNGVVNNFIWGPFGLVLLVATGVLMTFLTKFFQISHIGHWLKKTIGSIFSRQVSGHTKDKHTISQFQALCTALSATVGVGNIAGVATSIVSGGPGAVFWMWVAAFFGMMTNFSENVLGIYYRRKNAKGEWSGGAMYYLHDGLGSKKGCKQLGKVLAILFSLFCLLASLGIGNLGQINTIANNFSSAFKIEALSSVKVANTNLYMIIIGVVLMIIAALVIIGGIKRIASVTEKLVPFMVVAYLIGGIVIVAVNYKFIGEAFASIFSFAFGFRSFLGGTLGAVVANAITWGFKRGVFSNEAGLGSSVMVHSASNVKEPVRQGMWGIFEVFADTFLVCTLTALVILTSGLVDLTTGAMNTTVEKSVLVSEAFSGVFGSFGGFFVAIAILLFAFSTVLGWSYYGTKAWEYLFGTKSTIFYKTFFVLFILVSATTSLDLAWDISDTFNGLMMVPNLIGVVALSGLVFKITRNYVDRKIRKKDIAPILSYDVDIQKEMEDGLNKE